MSKENFVFATAAVTALLLAGFPAAVRAAGTPEQRRACTQDAFKFCADVIPNVPRITSCMIANMRKLSPACRAQFK